MPPWMFAAVAVFVSALANAAFLEGGPTEASKASLPFVHAAEDARVEVPAGVAWSARVGNKVFFAPPASLVQLSQSASNYYYAAGCSSALTAQMQQHLVGGDGRWHIFHLPEGPSMLKLPSGSRRNSFSALVQLWPGKVLDPTFPVYGTNPSYVHPGSPQAQEKETEAVNQITPELFEDYLTQVTSLGVGGDFTRSSSSTDASSHAIEFLQQKYQGMGLTTCLQPFHFAGKDYTNVIAYLPGNSGDSLTIGAHYDSRPFEGAAPGANDNGSGTAALLALAQVLTDLGVPPKRNVYFASFAAEEPGLYGSKAYVDGLQGSTGAAPFPAGCRPQAASFLQARKQQEANHKAIILDEVAWRSTFPEFPNATMQFESNDQKNDLMNHMAQANQLYNGAELRVTHSDAPFGSDHMPFIDGGLVAALVINGDDARYPSYHSSADTMDKVDMHFASKVIKSVCGGVFRAAGLQL